MHALLIRRRACSPDGCGCVILENADRTALPRQIECRNVLLRIPQWGTALPMGEDGGKRVYNLYEAGRVTAYFGRETRLEAMYGSN